jgi:hypothetical protein
MQTLTIQAARPRARSGLLLSLFASDWAIAKRPRLSELDCWDNAAGSTRNAVVDWRSR